jgi:uncharacterized protein involved in exopolysaccharide biosynthesis
MNNIELIKQLLKRLKKFSWLIILVAAGFGAFFYYMAKQSVPMYTSTATVFPLNSSGNNATASSTISSLLGMTDAQQSFTGEASINIVELASSRRTREAVAMTKVKNKTIAELLIEEHNRHTGFMQNETIKMPSDSQQLINIASNLLKGGFASKINKNGILELHYTNSNPDLVKEVSYVYIDKISSFYIELKKKKAQLDFDFAVKKADSLLAVLNALDKKAIAEDESTFFTNQDLQRYSIPKQNLAQDKATVQSQYYYAVNNRESAAYKLQKDTPIIEPLDRPEPPFDVALKSKMMYALIGLILGGFIGIILVSWKLISKYLGAELNKALEKAALKGKAQDELQPQTEPLK